MFDDVLKELEARLDIPYPQRTRVIEELEADLLAQYTALVDEGVAEDEARRAALRSLGLDAEALASLEAIHNPAIRRILKRLPGPARDTAEWICAGLPLIATLIIMFTEVPMLNFIREGGFGMYVILLMGGAALILQLRRAFSWFIARDHSERSLARNTATPLYLAAATLAFAFSATGLNVYTVLARAGAGTIPPEVVPLGIMESMTTAVMGGTLAALVILVQAVIQTGLRALKVKSA